jgi:hypothetical protein
MKVQWNLDLYDWGAAEGNLTGVRDALFELGAAEDRDSAEACYWRIDSVVVRDRLLKPGAAETATCLAQLLSIANPAQRLVTLELLGELAAGCVVPTAAAQNLVDRTKDAVCLAFSSVLDLAASSVLADERSLCIDILGCLIEIDPALRATVARCFEQLALKGIEIPWFNLGSP